MKIETPSSIKSESTTMDEPLSNEYPFTKSQKYNAYKFLLIVFSILTIGIIIADLRVTQIIVEWFEKLFTYIYINHNILFWCLVFISQFGGSLTTVPTHILTSFFLY